MLETHAAAKHQGEILDFLLYFKFSCTWRTAGKPLHANVLILMLKRTVKRKYRPLCACKGRDSGWIISSTDYNMKRGCHSATSNLYCSILCKQIVWHRMTVAFWGFVMPRASNINCRKNKSSEHEINMTCFLLLHLLSPWSFVGWSPSGDKFDWQLTQAAVIFRRRTNDKTCCSQHILTKESFKEAPTKDLDPEHWLTFPTLFDTLTQNGVFSVVFFFI